MKKHAHTNDEPSFGLRCWQGTPALMSLAHRHNDIELNYIEHGTITYQFGSKRVELGAGDVCLFWAAMPHQLCEGDATMYWVTLPLPLFLRWQLPDALSTAVLHGKPILRRGTADGGGTPLRRWLVDLAQGGGYNAVVQLELEAYLRRMALDGDANSLAPGTQTSGHAGQMAQYVADHFAEPLHVAKIAAHAGLHPHYAMQLFREAYGMSLINYVTRCRIAHAQQLLVTGDIGVLDVALESGFNSASRFYSAFKAECGMTPRAYRAAARG